MESFSLWQARVAETRGSNDSETVLFVAYNSVSAAQALAAGFESMGTSWDASGVLVKVYKPRPAGAMIYACNVCGGNSKHYQGMYCCGKKRKLAKPGITASSRGFAKRHEAEDTGYD